MFKKTALIPYMMGANTGTLADTLLVGIILEDADGVLVVIILAGLALIITIVALVAGNRFIESVEHLQDRIVGNDLFFEFWAVMPAAPNSTYINSFYKIKIKSNCVRPPHPKGWGMLRAARPHARFYGIQKSSSLSLPRSP